MLRQFEAESSARPDSDSDDSPVVQPPRARPAQASSASVGQLSLAQSQVDCFSSRVFENNTQWFNPAPNLKFRQLAGRDSDVFGK